MQTDHQTEVNTVFIQTLTGAILDLKNRLQQDYERAYPGLGNVVRIVLDEEEEKARDLSSFPHLLLPDLVETHMERLGLQPVAKKQDEIPIRHRFLEMPSYQPALTYVDC
jgi:hypothetical protein